MNDLFFELTNSLANLIRPLFTAFSPLITGLILAYLMYPVVNWFEIRLKSRGTAILITYVLVISAICGLIYAFVVLITGTLPNDFQTTIQTIRSYFDEATILRAESWLSSRLSPSSVANVVSSVTDVLVTIALGTVASVYLLKDKEFFIGLWEKFLVLVLRQRVHGVLAEIMVDINTVLATFLKGAFVDSIIVAFLSSAALTLTGMEYAVIIGILAGLLNIIPYFGPFISMVPAFLTALVSGGPFQGLLAILALLAVQQLDSNYIYPKIVGATTGLHPLFVLLSVSILGYFFGITGMLLAVPAAGILQVLITRWACSK